MVLLIVTKLKYLQLFTKIVNNIQDRKSKVIETMFIQSTYSLSSLVSHCMFMDVFTCLYFELVTVHIKK